MYFLVPRCPYDQTFTEKHKAEHYLYMLGIQGLFFTNFSSFPTKQLTLNVTFGRLVQF